jgi:hypothetical protein
MERCQTGHRDTKKTDRRIADQTRPERQTQTDGQTNAPDAVDGAIPVGLGVLVERRKQTDQTNKQTDDRQTTARRDRQIAPMHLEGIVDEAVDGAVPVVLGVLVERREHNGNDDIAVVADQRHDVLVVEEVQRTLRDLAGSVVGEELSG